MALVFLSSLMTWTEGATRCVVDADMDELPADAEMAVDHALLKAPHQPSRPHWEQPIEAPQLDKRIKTVTGAIEELSQVEPKCRRLMSVPGIGPIIATGIVAAIGRGEAFERGRDFAAWLGLVPRQHSTGGRTVLGRISKRGSKYLRTLLIQAARVLLMRPHNWSRYSFGAWLKTASQRLHKNKLAVALANKLARIAWSVLHNEKAFDTQPEAVAI